MFLDDELRWPERFARMGQNRNAHKRKERGDFKHLNLDNNRTLQTISTEKRIINE